MWTSLMRHLFFLPLLLFLILSVVVSVIAWTSAGWSAGLSALTASSLALMAGSGLKAASKDPWFRASRVRAVAALLALIAFWASDGFSVQLFGATLTGAEWAVTGLLISLLFTRKEFAERLW